MPFNSKLSQSKPAPKLALVGATDRSSPPVFRHVGLLCEALDVTHGMKVEVYDWAPPLRAPGRMQVDAIGWIDLSVDEVYGVELWLAEVESYEPLATTTAPNDKRYTVSSADTHELDPVTGRVRWRRFSCATFVERAYAEGAGRRLVVDESEFPEVGRETLERIWGRIAQRLTDDRAAIGIEGEGPWRVLLPGYLLSATRDGVVLPYRPSVNDLYCP